MRILTNLTRKGRLSILTFLHRRFLFLLRPKLSELLGQKILNGELVFVHKVRNVHCGTTGADPVGADWTGIPGRKAARLFFAVPSGAALDVRRDVGGNVEQHHVVT